MPQTRQFDNDGILTLRYSNHDQLQMLLLIFITGNELSLHGIIYNLQVAPI